MSPLYLPQQSFLRHRMLPPAYVVTPPPFSRGFYHPGSSENIECHLPEHGVNGILDQPREPGPEGIVMEMRDSKILFNDITDF